MRPSSPQPPPGGGLLLSVAGPSARLRAGLEFGTVRQDRAGRSLPAAEARSSYLNLRTSAGCDPNRNIQPNSPGKSILILNFELRPNGRNGPQLRPAKARFSRPLMRSFASCSPSLNRNRWQRRAAPPRRTPIRSAAGWLSGWVPKGNGRLTKKRSDPEKGSDRSFYALRTLPNFRPACVAVVGKPAVRKPVLRNFKAA